MLFKCNFSCHCHSPTRWLPPSVWKNFLFRSPANVSPLIINSLDLDSPSLRRRLNVRYRSPCSLLHSGQNKAKLSNLSLELQPSFHATSTCSFSVLSLLQSSRTAHKHSECSLTNVLSNLNIVSQTLTLNTLAYEGKRTKWLHYPTHLHLHFQGDIDLHPMVSLCINIPNVSAIYSIFLPAFHISKCITSRLPVLYSVCHWSTQFLRLSMSWCMAWQASWPSKCDFTHFHVIYKLTNPTTSIFIQFMCHS